MVKKRKIIVSKNKNQNKCKEFVFGLVTDELNHQKHRRETLDNKAGYLITLNIAILTFVGIYLQFPTTEQLFRSSELIIFFAYFVLWLGILFDVISLGLILWILLPDNYVTFNVPKLVELNVDDYNKLLPVIIEKKTEELTINEKINDKRFKRMKIAIIVLLSGFLLICISNIILRVNF